MHKENPQTYVQAFLSLDAYHNTYANAIHSLNADQADRNDKATNMPIAYMQMQDNYGGHNKEDRIVPPHACRQPGRPRVRRIKSVVEGPFVWRERKSVHAVMDWVMLWPPVMQLFSSKSQND